MGKRILIGFGLLATGALMWVSGWMWPVTVLFSVVFWFFIFLRMEELRR